MRKTYGVKSLCSRGFNRRGIRGQRERCPKYGVVTKERRVPCLARCQVCESRMNPNSERHVLQRLCVECRSTFGPNVTRLFGEFRSGVSWSAPASARVPVRVPNLGNGTIVLPYSSRFTVGGAGASAGQVLDNTSNLAESSSVSGFAPFVRARIRTADDSAAVPVQLNFATPLTTGTLNVFAGAKTSVGR